MIKRFLFMGTAASLVLISCYKDAAHNGYHGSRNITIDTALDLGTQYQLNLQPYGDADDTAAITIQAANFTTSEIVNSTSGFAPVYHFTAANAKTSLSEQVVIAVTEGSGRHPHNDSTIITINFKLP